MFPSVAETNEAAVESLSSQGRKQARRFTIAGYQEAVALYLEAREVEADWAQITAALSETYAFWGFRREILGQECASYYELAFEESERALAAAPHLGEAHRAMAKALQHGERADHERRSAESLEAMKINPYDAESCHEYWGACGSQPSDPAIFKAMALDPAFFAAPNDLGTALYAAGRLAEASFYFEKALKIIPKHPVALCNWAVLLSESGQKEQAQTLLSTEADPNDPLVVQTSRWLFGGAP